MNCEQVQELISQFIDGELDSVNESNLFGHLGSCEVCRTFLKNTISLRNALAAPTPVAVPADLDERVLNSIAVVSKRQVSHTFLWLRGKPQYSFRAIGLAVVLSITIGVFVSSAWYHNHQPQSTIVCLTPLPEVEVNGYVVTASLSEKGINQ
jgi:predicted anti-sigma-YlaC factor YlaD